MSIALTTHTARRLALLYALLLVAASSLPGLKLPDLSKGNLDKLLHGFEYAILGFLVARGWGPLRDVASSRLLDWLPLAILLIFAAIDEYHQAWIPGRFAEWSDWTADAIGLSLGYIAGVAANRRSLRKRGLAAAPTPDD